VTRDTHVMSDLHPFFLILRRARGLECVGWVHRGHVMHADVLTCDATPMWHEAEVGLLPAAPASSLETSQVGQEGLATYKT
jgi:hypothetical protein